MSQRDERQKSSTHVVHTAEGTYSRLAGHVCKGKSCGEMSQECVEATRDTCMYAVQIVEPHGTCHGNKSLHGLNVTFSLRPDPSCLNVEYIIIIIIIIF